jgi:hypothetical protein
MKTEKQIVNGTNQSEGFFLGGEDGKGNGLW